MSPMTNALITYWHRLPAYSPAERRQHLTLTCDGVRTGHLPPQALVPFALGDVDDDAVAGLEAPGIGIQVGGVGQVGRTHLYVDRGIGRQQSG